MKNNANLNLLPGDLNGRVGMNLDFGLVFTNVEYSDRGFYTCKGTNGLGTAVNSTQLNVMGKKKNEYIIIIFYNDVNVRNVKLVVIM